ncbi:hypothetical protein PR003_g21639 [Phytophthora rubi]|uniref:Uncharacterized protein n=1 Tax=Phytophthora rubi TaxID=129364 RepID=A0A6A4DN81_9STRA|nr:hypothetical protein PF003_g25217 [Phytophthora fragariae]KAE8992915.1 hypothetical protein PR002_g20393 [Phytophthora rubi]KAE9304887.1 hypothetical protein PR003_g21639 [Phytophthora rubi]
MIPLCIHALFHWRDSRMPLVKSALKWAGSRQHHAAR